MRRSWRRLLSLIIPLRFSTSFDEIVDGGQYVTRHVVWWQWGGRVFWSRGWGE